MAWLHRDFSCCTVNVQCKQGGKNANQAPVSLPMIAALSIIHASFIVRFRKLVSMIINKDRN
jgi:hypothetical protein